MRSRFWTVPTVLTLAVLGFGYAAWAEPSDKPLAADPEEDLKDIPVETQPAGGAKPPISAEETDTPEPSDGSHSPAATGTPGKSDLLKPQILTGAAKEKRLFEFLEREYARSLKTNDWIARSLAAVSLSRIPTRTAGDTVLNIVKTDKSDITRLVAWQAMLSRVKYLHLEHYDEWVATTLTMAEKGLFRGRLRVGLFRLLATVPPSDKAKAVFMKVFAETNALDSEDIPTLDAMGGCLAAWQSGSLVEQLIGRMSNLDDAFRAEYILRKAGATAPPATASMNLGSAEMWKKAQSDYVAWWNSAKNNWKEPTKSELAKWRALAPQFVESPPDPQSINIDDPRWKEELELGGLGLRSFDVGLVVDVTGSMGEVIAWLKRDVKKMMLAFSLVSREPRIGLTFYRDAGNQSRDEFVTQSVPLTDNTEALVKALSEMKAKGGGDLPEAVLEGMVESYTINPWVGGKESRKIILLIGDAPNHPETQGKLEDLIKKKTTQGFKLYAVKVSTEYGSNDLATFDAICKIGDGVAIPVDFPSSKGFKGLGELPPKKKTGSGMSVESVELPPNELCVLAVAFNDNDDPSVKVLKEVLIGVINPQYKNRLEPFVKTVLAYCEDFIPEKRRPWGPAPPPKPTATWTHGPHERHSPAPGPTPKPFNPQE